MTSKNISKIITKYWLGLFTVIVFLFFSIMQPRYCSVTNIMSMLSSTCILALVGMGETLIMCVGETDYSVGMELTVAAVVLAKVLDQPGVAGMYIPMLLLTLLIVIGYGIINVFLHVKIKIPSFVATLGTSLVATGICKWMTGGGSISSRRWPACYTFLGQSYQAGIIPISVIFSY